MLYTTNVAYKSSIDFQFDCNDFNTRSVTKLNQQNEALFDYKSEQQRRTELTEKCSSESSVFPFSACSSSMSYIFAPLPPRSSPRCSLMCH